MRRVRVGWFIVVFGIVECLAPSPALSWYWWAAFGGGSGASCMDGCTCAQIQQATIFPGTVPEGCYFNGSAFAIVPGHSSGGASRYGFATLFCDAGEYKTDAGCLTAPPADNAPNCQTLV